MISVGRKKKRRVIRCLAELQVDKEGNGVIVLTNLGRSGKES